MTDWHQYPTNYTDVLTNQTTSVNGVGDFFGSYPTSIVGSYGMGMVLVMWIVFFTLSSAIGVRKAVMTSSFITGVLSIYLWTIGLIDPWIIFLMILLTIIGALGGKEENY